MELNKYIEHTLLKQDAKKEEVIKLAQEAKEHNFKGVCVNSCNIAIVKEILKDTDVKIVSVVGFPLGDCTTATKAFETKEAVELGLIDRVGGLSDALDSLRKMIKERKEPKKTRKK